VHTDNKVDRRIRIGEWKQKVFSRESKVREQKDFSNRKGFGTPQLPLQFPAFSCCHEYLLRVINPSPSCNSNSLF
jgi:hypothetical protein